MSVAILVQKQCHSESPVDMNLHGQIHFLCSTAWECSMRGLKERERDIYKYVFFKCKSMN